MDWKKLERHSLSEIFPEMSEMEFESLRSDIRENGYDQKQPVIVFEEKVLDGWNRLQAAIKEDKQPTIEKFSNHDPLLYVIRRNLHRRHLDSSQRAMVAARVANRGSGNLPINGEVRNSDAAAMLNVSEHSVENAKSVLRNGTPKLQAAVDAGLVTITDAAKVAKESASVQNRAVKAVESGEAKTANAAVKQKVLCDSCQTRHRKGQPVKDRCQDCKDARNKLESKSKAVSDADESAVPQLDCLKKTVPEELREVFASVEEFRDMMRSISSIKSRVESIIKTEAGGWIDQQDTERSLTQAYNHLKFAMPHTECPKCRRKPVKKCVSCKGQGWVTKQAFSACASDDDKLWIEGDRS